MATTTKPTKPATNLDFNSVFATNSISTAFTWLLADYLKGWDAIENTPPSRQQFNALQEHSDKKENFLYKQYLEGYVDKFLDYLDTVKAPINSPNFTGTPKANGIPLGYGISNYSYSPWYFWIGDYYIVQYAFARTNASGIAKLQLPIATALDSEGRGNYIAIPVVYTTELKSYAFAIGGGQYRTANEVWIAVRDAETGEPANDVGVGALCWCVPA